MKYAIYMIVILACYSVVSSIDYADHIDSEARYNNMVCSGLWPDYRETEPDCTAKTELQPGRELDK